VPSARVLETTPRSPRAALRRLSTALRCLGTGLRKLGTVVRPRVPSGRSLRLAVPSFAPALPELATALRSFTPSPSSFPVLCSALVTAPPKPTPEHLWLTLVEEAGEDAITSAASTPVSQAEQDLIAAGFDVKAERARAHGHIAALTGERPLHIVGSDPTTEPTAWVSGPPAPAKRTPSSRRVVWLAAALAAAAATGGIVYAVAHRPKPPDKPIEVPHEPPSANAPAPPVPQPVAPCAPRATGPEKPPPPWADPKVAPRRPPATP
jgi:hypothetical protein